MKIYVVDIRKWIYVTYDEAINILKFGLRPKEFTSNNIKEYLLF